MRLCCNIGRAMHHSACLEDSRGSAGDPAFSAAPATFKALQGASIQHVAKPQYFCGLGVNAVTHSLVMHRRMHMARPSVRSSWTQPSR